MVKKISALLLALSLAFALTSCSGDSDNSSAVVENNDSTQTQADDTQQPADDGENHIGEYLQHTVDIFNSGEYTLKCTLTSTDFDGSVSIERQASDGKIYQLQTDSLGKRGYLKLQDNAYKFDYVCNMYVETDDSLPTAIETVAAKNLQMTSTHKAPDTSGSIIEEYTYTGDTYITVFDFYFDETSMDLTKYVTTYSVEGNDDIVETRTVDMLTKSAVGDVFGDGFTTTLTDFEGMTEDNRLSFCQNLCNRYAITTDEMTTEGITTDSFKKISYDDLINLIYKYAKI